MKQKYFIDAHKAITGLFVLLLIAIFDQWQNQTAWIYLALHGTYGILWVLKSRIFPDQQWEQPTGIGYGLVIWGSLSLYWVAPFLLVWRSVEAPVWLNALCTSIYSFGVFCHFASDMQKHTALKLQPERLITDGLFTRLRNTNYFGELLIYGSFALLSMHWLSLLVLVTWIVAFWLPNMRRKDRALALLDGFDAYRQRTWYFIPIIY
jgi:protein-S-isoprenylcysteine O-methyltransferase Ste14